jgi:drug/metabolite transporter (DMT)-like permease
LPKDFKSVFGGTTMSSRSAAILMLILATAAWGYSFPGGKALMTAFSADLPGRNQWFYSSVMISVRFALAALILIAFQPKALSLIRPSEWRQGIGLGFFAGIGMLLQSDGLQYTTASAVAFLTQFAAVLVPIYCVFRDRRAPNLRTIICIVMVMAGVAILGQFDWRTMRFGRGELETLVATVFFAAQILWLDRPIFKGNDTRRVSIIMFAACAMVTAPVWIMHAESPGDITALLIPRPGIGIIFLSLTVICSLVAFLLMNHWQPRVDATTAGIVYCAEPLFATVLALFLPEILGPFLGIHYPNEVFTNHLILGGSLITVANILVALAPPPATERSPIPPVKNA